MKRYSDKELLEFKALIDGKLLAAEKEVNFIKDQLAEIKNNKGGSQGGDITDENANASQRSMLVTMAERQQHFIKNLKNALIRIENKSYGICSITGELIDKKRLMLVPHATKTIVGKQSSANNSNASRGQSRDTKSKTRKTSGKIITKSISKATKSSKSTSNIIDPGIEGISKIDEADMLLEGIEELPLNSPDLKSEFEEE